MKIQRIGAALALGATLALSGCASSVEQACERGQGLNGMTLSETCQAAIVAGQERNGEIMAGVGAAVAASVIGLTVATALRPVNNNTYVYPVY